MKTRNEHYIKTQEYQITLDNKDEAHQFMSAISLLQESGVKGLLDGIMDKFSEKNSVYQFNTVELDLGTISKSDYEQELLFRLEEKLTNYFKANIRSDGTLRNGKRIVLNDHRLEQIEHFLVRGYLRWSASLAQSPSKLFNELMLENKKELVTRLHLLGKKEAVRKRMVYQLNEEILENIVTAVAQGEGSYMVSYKRNILKHQHRRPLVYTGFSAFRTAVWEIVLAYLFVESNTYYNKKSFLQYLIGKIAKKYNLTYQLLLEAIARGVKSEKKSSYGHAFKKIVLELDNDQREIALQRRSKRPLEKESTLDLIKQINYYLNFGIFFGKGQPESRQDFNHQFELLLQKKRQATLHHLTNWLGSTSKRNSLLLLLNDEVLPRLVGYLDNPFIEDSMAFVSELERKKSYLSADSKGLLQRIQQKKLRIILTAFEAGQYSKEDMIGKFIKALWNEFNQYENILFELFNDIKPQLPGEHHRALRRFLAKKPFKNTMGTKSSAESLPMQNTGIDLRKTKEFRKNMVHYVLNKGEIPWWGKYKYSWDDFNDDFATLWALSGHKKQILKLIQKKGQKISLYAVLNDNNLQQVWKALDKSPGKVHANLINEIHQLLKNQLLPVGSIKTNHYNEFVNQVFNLMLQGEQMQIDTALLNFIGKWAESSEITKGKSEKALLVSLLRKINRETTSISFKEQLTAWIDSWSGAEIRKDQPLNEVRTIRDLLSIYNLSRSQHGRHTPDLTVPLEQIITTAPKQFNDLLSREVFRDSLLNELPEKDIVTLISLNLNARQRQFLSASISILPLISSHISLQELKAIRKNYLKLTLLKLSAGGFASWQIESWGNLMFHCMTVVMGKYKSKAVLLKVHEKLLSKGKDQYKGEVELLDQIQRTAKKTSNPAGTMAGKKEEEKAYRKLGEEAEKELLNPVFIKNAGLIILAPYLGMLFEKCRLTKGGNFNNEESKFKAVHLLAYAANRETGKEEHELVINKLLCGMFINDPIERAIALHDQEKETVDSLLNAVTQQWPPLKNTSIDGLRTSFLQREGKLEEEEEQYYLKVEQKSFDMLLDQIPWNISKIKLSWMEKIIQVAWR